MNTLMGAATARLLAATTMMALGLLTIPSAVFAQLSGPKSIPGDYATIAAAITDLNTQGVGAGGVTFNVAAGHTETITGVLSVTATGTLADPIVFQKSGAGANPLVTAYIGGTGTPSSAVQDGICRLVGSDHVTIDGIDLTENPLNVANPATMEYGYALYKASATDGCQNVTIQNCTITLNRINNAAGSGPSVDGSKGIQLTNALPATSTTAVTVTSAAGSNSNNRLYSNIIQNCNIGIALIGFADVTPFTFADTNNDVGGSALATGNNIRNWGGGGTTSPAAGIRTLAQYGMNISYNTINNNDGAGVNHASTLRGIFNNTAVSASATISNNTVTVRSAATTSILTAIENAAGATAAGNTISINNNTITGCTYTTATTGAFTGIVNTANAPATLNINSNILSSNATNATSGTTNLIQNQGAVTVALNINSNTINGWTFNAATSGLLNGINSTTNGTVTAAVSISSNNVQSITHAVAGSSSHVYITYNNPSSAAANINSNTFTNLNVNTTGSVTFITRSGSMTATGSENVNGNSIVTAFNKGGAGGTVTCFGANASSVNGSTMTNNLNNFSNVTVTGATTIAGWSNTEGASGSSGPTKTITNNTFNSVTGGTSAVTVVSVNFSGTGTNVGTSGNPNTISNVTAAAAITGLSLGTSNTAAGTFAVTANVVDPMSSTGGAVIGISNLAPTANISGNSVRNLSSTTSNVSGITTAGAATQSASNNTIGPLSSAGNTTGFLAGTTGTQTVSGNTIGTLSSSAASGAIIGVSVTAGSTVTVTGNTINSLSGTGGVSPSAVGIQVTGATTTNLLKNKIYDLVESGALTVTPPAVVGVNILSGTTVNAHNNLIGDLRAPAASSAVSFVRGINVNSTAAGATYNLSYNSIHLNATSSGADFATAGVFHTTSATATTAALVMRDNIIVNLSTPNGAGVTAAYRRSNTTLTNYGASSNNNLFYAGTPSASRLIFYDGTNSDQLLSAYKTRVSPRDAASVTENPPFLSTTGSSANFLHIDPSTATQIESGGITVAGITDDYDGDTRNASTPDIGADEGTFILADLTGPAITYTPLGPHAGLSTRSFTNVTVTDPSGVDGTVGTRPRVYYKKSTDANTVVDNTNATNGWKYAEANGSTSQFDFTIDYSLIFGGSVAVNDVIEYFVVAQDLAGTPNVGINQGSFASTPASVALTAAAFPIGGTIRNYTIVGAPLNGDYTVGLTLFNQAIGANLTFERRVQKVMREVLEPADEVPQMSGDKTSFEALLADQIVWRKVQREVEEVTWVPMSNGQEFNGPLYVKRSEKANLPPQALVGVYATITAAVADLNVRGVSGPVRFLLLDPTYPSETFPITVNVTSTDVPTATNTVAIKPNTGVTSSVSGASATNAIFKAFNTNYITIDGSNAVSGTTRDLTIENTSATTPSVVWFGSSGTTPITGGGVKNCLVRNGVNTSSAVVISDGTTAGTAGYFSNIEIRNNKIERAFVGVFAQGGTTPANGSNLTYADNELNTSGANAIRLVGLYMQGVNGATVSGNTVANFEAASGENDAGIWVASGTTNATVSENNVSSLSYTGTSGFAPIGILVTPAVPSSNINVTRNTVTGISTNGSTQVRGIATSSALTADVVIQRNNVSGISNTNTGTFGAYGIDASAGNNHTIKNNFVSDIKFNMTGGAAFSTTFGLFGIRVGSGTGHIVDDNSVSMFGALPGTANSSLLTAGLGIVATGSTSCDLRNNILSNTISGGTTSIAHVSLYLPSGGTAAMNLTDNNNAYYSGTSATTQGIAQVGTTAGTGFYLASNFNPGATTPATNLRAYTSTLSGAGTNDDAALASTAAAPYTSNTDLHILTNTPSPVSNTGVTVAGITDDFDGDVRQSPPDIGADEFCIASVTASAGPNGTVAPTGTTTVACGNDLTYTITPDPCYAIQDVLVDGVSVGAVGTYTFMNLQANHTISATFVQITYTITASAGGGGSIAPGGVTGVPCGNNQSYTITPDPCFAIQDVLVDGVSQGPITNYTFTNVQADHTISATFVQITYTITASAGPNGSIAPNGPTVVGCGNNQSYTITPDPCFAIQDVLVDGVSQGPITNYTFTNVQADHTISATFVQITYTITASTGPNGSVTPNGATVVPCGNNQSYTITPDPCYAIQDVLVDGVSQGPIANYTFTNVQADHTISATFVQITYTITASSGPNGSVSPNGATVVPCGNDQNYTITADPCYAIQDVLVDGVSQGPISNYTFTNVQANHTISATFVQITYTITASAGPNGSITPNGPTVVGCGNDQSYTIAADPCYAIQDVLVDGVSQGPISNYTFTNVQANHTISATFVQITYTITASSGPNGSVTPNGATVVPCGNNQSYTITADPCYAIDDVLVDGVSQGPITNYTFTNVQANHTVSATFVQITYTITASAGPGGSVSPPGATVVPCGNNQSYTITPNPGFVIVDVLVDGVSQGPITNYTFTNVQANHTISATFRENVAPSVTVIQPNGGETLIIGSIYPLTWTANDNVGVTCVDLLLSRNGPSGPWETIATCIPNSSPYLWTVTGPPTTTAIFRVDAYDAAGNIGTDQSDAVFTIMDFPTATVVAMFQANPMEQGVRVEWRINDTQLLSEAHLQRSEREEGPFEVVDAPVVIENGTSVVVDRAVTPGQEYFYRLEGTTPAGQVVEMGTVNATAGVPIREFAIEHASPNPTSGPARIGFAIPRRAAIRLSLFDVQGREVAVLADGPYEPGRYMLTWSGQGAEGPLSSGVYFLRFHTPGKVQSRRIVLNK